MLDDALGSVCRILVCKGLPCCILVCKGQQEQVFGKLKHGTNLIVNVTLSKYDVAQWCRQVSQDADQNSKEKKIQGQITGEKLVKRTFFPSSNL